MLHTFFHPTPTTTTTPSHPLHSVAPYFLSRDWTLWKKSILQFFRNLSPFFSQFKNSVVKSPFEYADSLSLSVLHVQLEANQCFSPSLCKGKECSLTWDLVLTAPACRKQGPLFIQATFTPHLESLLAVHSEPFMLFLATCAWWSPWLTISITQCYTGMQQETLAAHCCSDASWLWNCRNSSGYIYRPHEWKASMPVRPQKMRTGHIFEQPCVFLFVSVL